MKSPRNADLLANIDWIGVGALEALWTESEPFPDNEIVLVKATRTQLEGCIDIFKIYLTT